MDNRRSNSVNRAVRAARLVSEAERRVHRGRQIVARQREFVAKFGEQVPIALALLKNFEDLLALFERTQALNEALAVEAEQSVVNAAVAAPMARCHEPADPVALTLDHQDQTCDIDHIMEILREAGYHCELLQENLQ
jgi:hypothetical protein